MEQVASLGRVCSLCDRLSRIGPALIAGFLAACSGTNSCPTGNPFTVFADPGEFEFFSCEQLLPQRNGLVTRAQELKLLMDKAEQSTGGAIVNVIAYKADYVTARERLKVIEETARIKKCNFPDDAQSNAAIR
jgi:hypothetical protein